MKDGLVGGKRLPHETGHGSWCDWVGLMGGGSASKLSKGMAWMGWEDIRDEQGQDKSRGNSSSGNETVWSGQASTWTWKLCKAKQIRAHAAAASKSDRPRVYVRRTDATM